MRSKSEAKVTFSPRFYNQKILCPQKRCATWNRHNNAFSYFRKITLNMSSCSELVPQLTVFLITQCSIIRKYLNLNKQINQFHTHTCSAQLNLHVSTDVESTCHFLDLAITSCFHIFKLTHHKFLILWQLYQYADVGYIYCMRSWRSFNIFYIFDSKTVYFKSIGNCICS